MNVIKNAISAFQCRMNGHRITCEKIVTNSHVLHSHFCTNCGKVYLERFEEIDPETQKLMDLVGRLLPPGMPVEEQQRYMN